MILFWTSQRMSFLRYHCNPRNKMHRPISIYFILFFWARAQSNARGVIQIYAPWCGHCQALEPTYNKLAKHLRDIESLVIAKMDGTTNEHPRAKVIQNSDIPQLMITHDWPKLTMCWRFTFVLVVEAVDSWFLVEFLIW